MKKKYMKFFYMNIFENYVMIFEEEMASNSFQLSMITPCR